MKKKICLQCKKEKYLWGFKKNPLEMDGFNCFCNNCLKYNKKYRKTYNKNYRKNNILKPKESQKIWNEKNKEKRKLYRKLWYQENKESIRKSQKRYKKYYAKNTNVRILNNLRSRLCHGLKNNAKRGHTLELLGCTIFELKNYLENQFTEGMNWENYGKWHIDHKRPLASFDLNIPENQAKACHYTNLQPLWAVDNLMKSDSWI